MATRPFHELVAEFGEGEFTERAGEIWAEIMRALKKNGGKASMKVTFTAEVLGEKVSVDTTFNVKKPYPPIPQSGFYIDDEGNLTVRQGSLGFKVTPIRGPRDPKGPAS